jgi:signal peptidase I
MHHLRKYARTPGARAGPRTATSGIFPRLVLALAVALIGRVWFVEGLLVPFQVVSASMAETLRGPHRQVRCRDCGLGFAFGAEGASLGSKAVCPHCGCAENESARAAQVAGDRLMVDKLTFRFRGPRRWEPVAFRHPERPRETSVKRVVGLPGESIEIRHGDIYVEGVLQRKPLEQQRGMAVLVHDTGWTRPGLQPRWVGGPLSRWQAAPGRFIHPPVHEPGRVDWLTYRHATVVPGKSGRLVEGPIGDVLPYNQGRTLHPKQVHPVPDAMLTFRLARVLGAGGLFLRATDGRDEFEVRIDTRRRVFEVARNGRPLCPPGKLPDGSIEGVRVEWSLFDRQVLLAWGGDTVLALPYDGDDALPGSSSPLAIGSDGLGIEIRDLRVYRDVYYGRPFRRNSTQREGHATRLREGEYYVLGDNSAVSDDSRFWPDPALPGQWIVGRPLLVHLPARPIGPARWRFQVPDPARIRYIR